MALPKRHRLKSRQDFQAVFREGIRRHGQYMTLRALRPSSLGNKSSRNSANLRLPQKLSSSQQSSSQLTPTQIGISISTKVSKRAVVRNRIKRQITTALFDLLPKTAPGWRLVLIVKPIAAEQGCVTQQFLQELEQLLMQVEVLNGHS